MVRTRADNTARKAVAAKAPRKVLGNSGGASSSAMMSPSGKTSKYAGGNSVCPRPTPEWQKGIGGFFGKSPKADKENEIPEEIGESSAAATVEPTSCSEGASSTEPSSQSSGSSSAGSSAERNGIISDDED